MIVMSCLQVLTIKQYATLYVQSYPHLIQTDCMLEALARERNEPTQQQILASAHTVDTRGHWANMRAYHAQLTDDTMHTHVPFKAGVGATTSSGSEETTALYIDADTATWFLNR